MSADHYFQGFHVGITGYRLKGKHVVPSDHPQGFTVEGREWFLGVLAGLMQQEATEQAEVIRQEKQIEQEL